MMSSVAGHFADALIAQKWTVLSVRRMMTCLGLVCPGIFLLFFSAVNNLALAVMFVCTYTCFMQFVSWMYPVPSSKHCLSYDDSLDDDGKLSKLFCSVFCATVVQNDMHTREQFLQFTVGFMFRFSFYSAKKLKFRRVLQTLCGTFERCSCVRL